MSDKQPVKIEVSEKFLETVGNYTLSGALAKLQEPVSVPSKEWAPVVLVFPESTTRWREKNGNPYQYIVNEYTIRCLIEDILWLQSQGVKISVEVLTRNPT